MFSVATYNVHRCIGRDRRRDPDRVRRVLHELDARIVGLQEVESALPEEGPHLLALAQQDGFHVVSGPTLIHPGENGYGNALLLSAPPLSVRRHDLSVAGREPRGALDVTVGIDGSPLRVIVTHLGLRVDERRRQFTQLLEVLGDCRDMATVLLGDFNEWRPRTRALRDIARALTDSPSVRTYPARRPLFALDRIWVSAHLQQHAVAAHSSGWALSASDHLPLKARLELL
ncbi:MAG: endonuclease/exonuclease/phosphatase family protein [Gammaproteobacteria bacterium]|jgi:phospholipase D1/2